MVVDFDDLARIVRTAVIDKLDHRHLNDTIENPTSENIALWIWRRLAPQLPGLTELTLWETATACAVLRADDPRSREARNSRRFSTRCRAKARGPGRPRSSCA